MKQQHDREERGIYPQLKGEFSITEEQKRRLAGRIRARAGIAPSPEIEPENAEMQRPVKHAAEHTAGSRLLALRFLPLAACLLLTFGTGFFLFRGLKQNQEPEQISRTDLAEQTTSATADTTLSTSEHTEPVTSTESASGTAATTDTESTQTAPEQTAPEQTSGTTSTATGTDTIPPQPQSTRQTAVTTEPASSSTVTTTTAESTGVSDTTAAQSEEYPADSYVLLLRDQTAHAGETITLELIQATDYTFSGIELHLDIESDGAPLPELQPDEVITLGEEPGLCTVFGSTFHFVTAVSGTETLPAGTVLCTVRCTIPENAAPGTVYRFVPTDSVQIIAGDSPYESVRPVFRLGSVTVAAP